MTGRDWASILGREVERRYGLPPEPPDACRRDRRNRSGVTTLSASDIDSGMWRLVGSIRRTLDGGVEQKPRQCTLLPSRSGEFHPEPLTDPDLNLSIHPARATARRLPPSAEPSGSSRYDPVGPGSTSMTHPRRSMGIAPLRRYYEAVRPSPAHRYFQPHGWSRLCFFPWHRRPGSHVPYKSLVELRAASMPDAAWAVSVHPPS